VACGLACADWTLLRDLWIGFAEQDGGIVGEEMVLVHEIGNAGLEFLREEE
jgi:hypothetical protein